MSRRFPASIVLPLLNQVDEYLETSVRSAVEQTIPVEVVVIASPRTTTTNLEVLARVNPRRSSIVIQYQRHGGFAAAINEGFRTASSDRVGLLLSDDWLMPSAVEECLQYNRDIISTSSSGIAADGKTPLHSVSRDLSRGIYKQLPSLEEKANYLSHFFLFRRSKIEEVGGLDESLGDCAGVDDFDFIWTLLERRATVGIVETSLYIYRDHDHERLTLRPYQEQMQTLVKILDKHAITGQKRAALLWEHGRWYGKPIHVAQAEFARATGPNQSA